MLIKIKGKFEWEMSNNDTAIEVPQEILNQIGITKCFDVENN